jgi:hypothetical protein
MANRFMASFTPFLLKYAEEGVVKDIIRDNFRKFYDYYVLRYSLFEKNRRVSIVGSVAHYFSQYLVQVADERDVQVDTILQHPMEGLIQYHSTALAVSR